MAEATRIRHSGETSLLTAAVSAVQATLQAALAFASAWVSSAPATVVVELNHDFVSAPLDAQTLVGLVQAYQAGALALPSLLTAMQDGQLIPQRTDVAEEAMHLEARRAAA